MDQLRASKLLRSNNLFPMRGEAMKTAQHIFEAWLESDENKKSPRSEVLDQTDYVTGINMIQGALDQGFLAGLEEAEKIAEAFEWPLKVGGDFELGVVNAGAHIAEKIRARIEELKRGSL